MTIRTERELKDALDIVDSAIAEGSGITTQISLLSCRNVLAYALGEEHNGFTAFMHEYRRSRG